MALYTTKQASEILPDLSYRQFQYWDTSRFIGPSYRKGGRFRMYTKRDLMLLEIAATLMKNGYSVQRIRSPMRRIQHFLEDDCRKDIPLENLIFLFNRKNPENFELFNTEYLEMNPEGHKRYLTYNAKSLCEKIAQHHADSAGERAA